MKHQLYNGKKVIWESKIKRVLLTIVCFAFAISGIYIYNPDDKSASVFFVIFFGGGGAYFLFQLLNPKNIFATDRSKLGKEILAEQSHIAQDVGVFIYNDAGFIFSERTYNWTDIATVFSFKKNMITTDDIFLDIFMNDGTLLRLHEKIPGWFHFTERLDSALSVAENLWQAVTYPAFETNVTLLYDSEGRTKEECETALYN